MGVEKLQHVGGVGYRKRLRMLLIVILLLQALGLAITSLEIIPPLRQGQLIVATLTSLLSILAAAYAGVLLLKRYLSNRSRGSAVLAFVVAPLSIVLCSLVSFYIWFACSAKEGFAVGGRELEYTADYEDYDTTIYVYAYSEIPDGFEKSFLMVRDTWLPIMRRVASVPYRIDEIQREDNLVLFRLDAVTQRGERGVLYYDLVKGTHWTNLEG